jgi:hypothetical protein
MPSWRREAEALIAEALGVSAVCWVEIGAAVPALLPVAMPLVLSLVGHVAPETERTRTLAELVRLLGPDATLVVVDHNRPRRSWAACRALVGPPRVPGLWPATRWRRLAQTTARAVQRAGFTVDRLRFAARERVQIVIATRR